MGTSRRQFIKGGTALTALSTFDLQNSCGGGHKELKGFQHRIVPCVLLWIAGTEDRALETNGGNRGCLTFGSGSGRTQGRQTLDA